MADSHFTTLVLHNSVTYNISVILSSAEVLLLHISPEPHINGADILIFNTMPPSFGCIYRSPYHHSDVLLHFTDLMELDLTRSRLKNLQLSPSVPTPVSAGSLTLSSGSYPLHTLDLDPITYSQPESSNDMCVLCHIPTLQIILELQCNVSGGIFHLYKLRTSHGSHITDVVFQLHDFITSPSYLVCEMSPIQSGECESL